MRFRIVYVLLCSSLLAIGGICSCVPVSSHLSSEPEQMLDGVVDFGDVGNMPACFITLSEPRFVNRVVVHTEAPVKGIEIHVSKGKDRWERVKQFKTPINAATSVTNPSC